MAPRNTAVETPADADAIDRSDLRGYHRSLQDFILQEVHQNGLRYRIAKNAVLLYPLDGTAPASVYARSNDSQVRNLAQWHNKHVKPALDLLEKGEVDEAAVAALAAQVNDPVEHPQEEPVAAAVEEPIDIPTPEVVPEAPVEVRVAPSHVGWTDPLSFEIDYKRVPNAYGAPRGWTWYVGTQGDIIEAIATNGEQYMCLYCERTDRPFHADRAIAIGGHRRWKHSPDGGSPMPLDPEVLQEAQKKSVLSRGMNKQAKIEAKKAIDILCAAVRYYPRDPNQPKAKPRAEGVSKADHDKVVAERDDALARIALMQEAFRGL